MNRLLTMVFVFSCLSIFEASGSFLDESNRLEFERLEKEHARGDLEKAIQERDGIPTDRGLTSSNVGFKRTTLGESVWGAVKNLPIVQTIQALDDHLSTEYDPNFDATATATMLHAKENIPSAEYARLTHANNQEEFDLIRENQAEQRVNRKLANDTKTGEVFLYISDHSLFIALMILTFILKPLRIIAKAFFGTIFDFIRFIAFSIVKLIYSILKAFNIDLTKIYKKAKDKLILIKNIYNQ